MHQIKEIDKIRVVDEELAYLLGEKILGSQLTLGSQVELGHLHSKNTKRIVLGNPICSYILNGLIIPKELRAMLWFRYQ